MTERLERLAEEAKSLAEKIVRLADFLSSQKFRELTDHEKLMLEIQLDYMYGYHHMVEERLRFYLKRTREPNPHEDTLR